MRMVLPCLKTQLDEPNTIRKHKTIMDDALYQTECRIEEHSDWCFDMNNFAHVEDGPNGICQSAIQILP